MPDNLINNVRMHVYMYQSLHRRLKKEKHLFRKKYHYLNFTINKFRHFANSSIDTDLPLPPSNI